MCRWNSSRTPPTSKFAHARSGAVYADIGPGNYRVTLAQPGYGSKRVQVTIAPGRPHQFRLLSDGLLGYAWPKWVCAGEQAEFRVHSVEPYKIDLWRYGLHKEHAAKIGWFDEHGPLATMQITPDGDYTQTGVQWNKVGYGSRQHAQYVTAPQRSGLYYFHARTDSGRFFAFPWIVAPASPQAPVAVLASNITWNAYNNFGGRSNYIHADRLPPTPTVNARIELSRYNDPEFGTWNATDYAPLSFDRPEPINHVPEATRAHRSDRRPRRLPRGAGRMAAAGLDGARGLRLRPVRRNATARRPARPRRLSGAGDQHASGVLVARDVPGRESPGSIERGGRLMYLGGNGLNCEVSFSDPATMIAHNGDNRMLQANLARYESRFGMRVESEANLLGVVYTESGVMTAAPYRVVAADHWVFDGTGLRRGQPVRTSEPARADSRRGFGP